MRIKCKCGAEIEVYDDVNDNDDVAHNIELALSAIRGHQTRLSALEKEAEQVTPLEDLVERHRRLVEYALGIGFHSGKITEAQLIELRANLHVGG